MIQVTLVTIQLKIQDMITDNMEYRRCGASGILLPVISIGLWHNFGDVDDFTNGRKILRCAFDHGVTHFDLANNYGPPYGSAEENFGRMFRKDFKAYRDELIISSKAGWDMWPGPYGNYGSKKYLVASLDQSLKRMGLDYVDIFYHHRPDPDTPLEEDMGTRLFIHQPRYSMMDRWVEKALLTELGKKEVGAIAFSPLEQGILTNKYLKGFPKQSRAVRDGRYLNKSHINPTIINKVKKLNVIAEKRGQTMAQMSIAWLLKDKRITSVLVGVSSPKQMKDNIDTVDNLSFTKTELNKIEKILKS